MGCMPINSLPTQFPTSSREAKEQLLSFKHSWRNPSCNSFPAISYYISFKPKHKSKHKEERTDLSNIIYSLTFSKKTKNQINIS